MKKHIAKNIIIALLLFAGISSCLCNDPRASFRRNSRTMGLVREGCIVFFRMPFYCFFPAVVWKGL